MMVDVFIDSDHHSSHKWFHHLLQAGGLCDVGQWAEGQLAGRRRSPRSQLGCCSCCVWEFSQGTSDGENPSRHMLDSFLCLESCDVSFFVRSWDASDANNKLEYLKNSKLIRRSINQMDVQHRNRIQFKWIIELSPKPKLKYLNKMCSLAGSLAQLCKALMFSRQIIICIIGLNAQCSSSRTVNNQRVCSIFRIC